MNKDHLSDKAQQDLELVERAISGDQSAYATLMDRYRESIYFMMLKMVKNTDDADDLTIEAFGKAFRRLEQYSPSYAFSTWLFKIASNNCIDFIRKKRIKVTSMDSGIQTDDGEHIKIDAKSNTRDPEETMEHKQKVIMMREVGAKLKPRYRILVEKRYFEELSYEEISEELNLPLGTVKAQLFRARDFPCQHDGKHQRHHLMEGIELILHYFPDITQKQRSQFEALEELYQEWNSHINVISRKDTDNFYERHVLHSLAIAKVMSFKDGSKILDIGTGGGFPGIPLAILYPECDFLLVDSIGKKIKVVNEVAGALELKNVHGVHERAEKVKGQFDFIVSRAVTAMPKFLNWTKGKFLKENNNDFKNGILYLKGGDLSEEMAPVKKAVQYFEIPDFFEEEFFETKKVVYVRN